MNIKISILFLFSLIPFAIFSQQRKTVQGKVQIIEVGTQHAKALTYANIIILEKQDSTFIKGVGSDDNGNFTLQYQVQKEKHYILKVSCIGLQSVYRELNDTASIIKLAPIVLEEKAIALEEVVIAAKAPDIKLEGDTVVINAEVYKTPEGSYLEELVKRIPGLEYDFKYKALMYNGLPINSININGEDFFSGNNSMALENLPVELISKIKVYDKRSELEKITGIKSDKENYIIDIQTKEEFNSTLVGAGKVGYGSKDKREAEIIGNYFTRQGENISLIANSTNRNSTTQNKSNIQNTIGTNFTQKSGKNLTINGNTFYSGNKNGSYSTNYTEQYLTTGNQYQLSDNENKSNFNTINSLLNIRCQVDEKTYLNVYGNYNFIHNENKTISRQGMYDTNPEADLSDPFGNIDNISPDTRINDVDMISQNSNKTHTYSLNANLTRKINTKDTSVSLILRYNNGDGESESLINSTTTYYRIQNLNGYDSILNRNQYIKSPTKNSGRGIGLMLTHPFSKKINVQFSYQLGYENTENNRNTYDLSETPGNNTNTTLGHLPSGYETGYIDSLSNKSESRTNRHEVSLRFNYNNSGWNINAGISTRSEQRSINQKVGLLHADTTTRTIAVNPTINALWKRKSRLFRLSYLGNTQQPSLTDLISLTNNSDPLNITRGNPNLKASYNQTLRLDANDTQKGLFGTINWQNTINGTTRSVIYNFETGGRESYPVNINGNWSGNIMLRYQKSLQKFKISARTGSLYNRNVGLINEGQSEYPMRSITRSVGFNNNLRLSYIPKWGNFDLSGDWQFQHSYNSLRESSTYTRVYSISLDTFVSFPFNIQLRSNANYSFRNGTNINKGDDELVWNTGFSWKFMKKKQAELSGSWSDILNKKKNYTRNTSADGFSEQRTQQIGTYFIVSFKYSINYTFKKQ